MEMKPLQIMSFLEWRQHYLAKKKKEQRSDSRSLEAAEKIEVTNGEVQGAGHHSEIPVQSVHVFPSPGH